MGTTAEKLSYLNTTKTKIKDVLNLGGANITNETFRQYVDKIKDRYLYYMLNGTQVIWNNWNKVSGTGTSLTLNNTEEAPMSLTYKGNTQQSGTPTPSSPIPVQVVSGDNSINILNKNLVNTNVEKKSSYPTTTIGSVVSYVNSSASSSYVNCCYLEAGTTYTFSCKLNTPASTTYRDSVIVDKNNIVLEHFYLWNNSTHNTYTPTHSGYLILCVDNNSAELMIEKGNQATTYEAYKGASYPINLGNKELCKIGTYQDKIDKSTGKNLFDKQYYLDHKNDFTHPSGNSYFYFLKLDDSFKTKFVGSMSLFGTSQTNLVVGFDTQNISAPTVDKRVLNTGGSLTNIAYDFTNATDVYMFVGASDFNITIENRLNAIFNNYNIMLNEGTTALPYEPYGTGWYLKKEIGKTEINLTGTLGTLGNGNKYVAFVPTNKMEVYGNLCYCNKANYSAYNQQDGQFYQNTANFVFVGNSTDTLETMQTKYNGALLYYILATPTYEPITDTTLLSQLEALKKSYENVTNISQVNNDMPFELDITALEEMN